MSENNLLANFDQWLDIARMHEWTLDRLFCEFGLAF